MSETYYYLYGTKPVPNEISSYVCVDTETTGLTWTDDTLGISIAWRDNNGSNMRSCYLSKVAGLFQDDIWNREQTLALMKELFRGKMVIGHYLSFDARTLFREFDITPRWPVDTWHMVKSLCWMPSYSLAAVAASIGINDPIWMA